ncbi:MAG: class I SAM-dependent RNA methyltransferase [Pseudomonadota bacterium]
MSAEYVIERLGRQGDGVAEGPVFVPRSLPREVVTGAVVDGRMPEPRIVTPAPDRVRAPCRHFGACGGCALQHASDTFVADWKQAMVREALEGAGLEAPIRGIETSPPRARRRAVFSGRRTKKGAVVGFHGRRSAEIVAVPECHVISDPLRAALPALEEIVREGTSRKGEIALTVTETAVGPDVAATGGKPLEPVLQAGLAQIAERHRLARISWEGEIAALRATPRVAMGRAQVPVPPGAFLQATEAGAAALVAAVAEATEGAKRIADLFSGCGTFALPLAARAEVQAVEGDAALVTALEAGWREVGGLHRVSAETRDLFRRPLLPDELRGFEAVVIDPPRAGAEAQSRALAGSDVARIAAVSCNPVTFARDAGLLVAGGYHLDWVQVVDQFRWSAHIELAAQFSRPG